jgi:UDP-N-acetyl-D-mannosaminuronate dehydrogenase
MVHLIVGYGEVGKALHKVLGKAEWIDTKKKLTMAIPDVIHVCIPYQKYFEDQVKVYVKSGALVIVHSSVPVGTCDKLGVVHSPIRGVHPHLEKGIRTFVKYFGGKDAEKAANIFRKLGLKTKVYPDAKTTEAMKLWDTTQYGRLIMLEKEIHDWCKKNNISFDAVYNEANKTYNEGYTKLGMSHVVRPILKHMEGEIGGHCVLPNAKLLKVKL